MDKQAPKRGQFKKPPLAREGSNIDPETGDKIPRPPNCFILYRRDRGRAMPEVLQNSTVSKIVGLEWQDLPESKKNEYRKKAEEWKRQHKQKYPHYKYSPAVKGQKRVATKQLVAQDRRTTRRLRTQNLPQATVILSPAHSPSAHGSIDDAPTADERATNCAAGPSAPQLLPIPVRDLVYSPTRRIHRPFVTHGAFVPPSFSLGDSNIPRDRNVSYLRSQGSSDGEAAPATQESSGAKRCETSRDQNGSDDALPVVRSRSSASSSKLTRARSDLIQAPRYLTPLFSPPTPVVAGPSIARHLRAPSAPENVDHSTTGPLRQRSSTTDLRPRHGYHPYAGAESMDSFTGTGIDVQNRRRLYNGINVHNRHRLCNDNGASGSTSQVRGSGVDLTSSRAGKRKAFTTIPLADDHQSRAVYGWKSPSTDGHIDLDENLLPKTSIGKLPTSPMRHSRTGRQRKPEKAAVHAQQYSTLPMSLPSTHNNTYFTSGSLASTHLQFSPPPATVDIAGSSFDSYPLVPPTPPNNIRYGHGEHEARLGSMYPLSSHGTASQSTLSETSSSHTPSLCSASDTTASSFSLEALMDLPATSQDQETKFPAADVTVPGPEHSDLQAILDSLADGCAKLENTWQKEALSVGGPEILDSKLEEPLFDLFDPICDFGADRAIGQYGTTALEEEQFCESRVYREADALQSANNAHIFNDSWDRNDLLLSCPEPLS